MLVRRLDRKGGGAYQQSRIGQAWLTIAGPAVIAHTTGAHLREREMVVFVDSPLWATELSALSEHYRASVNKELGEELVRAVRFTVSKNVDKEKRIERVLLESEEHHEQDKVEPVDLSENELAQIESSVAGIPDEELRRAVLRATVADFQWKKGLKARAERQGPSEGL
jgi:hypothetical protein